MADQASLANRLLSRLPPADFALLSDHLEPVSCPRGRVLKRLHRRTENELLRVDDPLNSPQYLCPNPGKLPGEVKHLNRLT